MRHLNSHPLDGKSKQRQIAIYLGEKDYKAFVLKLYTENMMSGQEIADYVRENTGIEITARSIQRMVKKYGGITHITDGLKLNKKLSFFLLISNNLLFADDALFYVNKFVKF